jgi:HEPN domain-containing protein
MHDLVCFHCQQAAEKYLKAILNEQGMPVPRTHDLETLHNMLLPTYPLLRTLRRGLKFLIQFAVDARYPGFNATKRQAASALRWAGQVRAACRAVLRLPPPRSPHRSGGSP